MLSEAIILQSLEDLFNQQHRMDALRFFNGEGFGICASIIGLNRKETERIFEIVNKSFDVIKKSKAVKKSTPSIYNKFRQKHLQVPRIIHGAFYQSADSEAAHHF